MQANSPNLFIEIEKSKYSFFVIDNKDENNFLLVYKNSVPCQGIDNGRIIDIENIYEIFRDNIYLIEKRLNFTFKEFTLILDDCNFSFSNLTGFKKLNGSQLVKENISYIINSLKSSLSQTENNKKILHIFNTKYCLDRKNVQNLPIGLFGDFYTHELSFCLIEKNFYKNLKNVFDKCNLRFKKIINKSFLQGISIIKENENLETFLKVEINEKNSKIFFFENSALKYVEEFTFGSDLIVNDISKILAFDKETVLNILINSILNKKINEEEILEKEYFGKTSFRKIKKTLIFEIATARIQEFAEIFIFKNINIKHLIESKKTIVLSVSEKSNFNCFKKNYEIIFSNNNQNELIYLEEQKIENILRNAFEIVHFGWKKEAVPVVQAKKSIIARLFSLLFE